MPIQSTALSVGPPLLLGVAAGLATLGGGVLAIVLRTSLSLLAAFGGGAVVCIALLDLAPEALALGKATYPPGFLLGLIVLGFSFYFIIDRWRHGAKGRTVLTRSPTFGPLSLVGHSLIDGLGIGVAFSLSPAIGWTIGAAVLAHDLLDGSNTVTLSFSSGRNVARAWFWLAADALAPLVGIVLSRMITPSPAVLAPLLATLAGIFLFIGAGELLPLSLRGQTALRALLTALCGGAIVTAVLMIGAR